MQTTTGFRKPDFYREPTQSLLTRLFRRARSKSGRRMSLQLLSLAGDDTIKASPTTVSEVLWDVREDRRTVDRDDLV